MHWFYVDGPLRIGPLSDSEWAEAVRSGKIQPGTLVWHEGLPTWTPYAQVPPPLPQKPEPEPDSEPDAPETGETDEELQAAWIARMIARDYPVSIRSCVGRAWGLLRDHFWMLAGSTLLMTAIIMVFMQFPGLDLLMGMALQGVLFAGLCNVYLRLMRGEPVVIVDLANKRVLVFIVAYNAEKTIGSVLSRIPVELRQPGVEVLVIDDFSRDKTFQAGLQFQQDGMAVTMLRTPENQGYGGNQKLGYRYAIEHGFDIVALVHGDGQYAPEKLPDLLAPLVAGEADAVFGSRMIKKGDALKGGMPLYKWVGNQVLSAFQNWLLGTRLSEFHSGYRLYSVAALRRIPFERNSNDFHFDTEIIVQLVLRGLRIRELPIPTFYGDEICHVNGLKYAGDVVKTMFGCRVHQWGIFFDRRFDLAPESGTPRVERLKLGYPSSHSLALELARPGCRLLLWEDAPALAEPLARKGVCVSLAEPGRMPPDPSLFDQIFLLDTIEHHPAPEQFVEDLRAATTRARPEIVITTANVAFFATRGMLLLGRFNYSQRGILDLTHTRLFTFTSLRALLHQAGYKILETRGIPAPFPKALGDCRLSRMLLRLNSLLIRIAPKLFAYQILLRVKAQPTVKNLLAETISTSAELRQKIEEEAGAPNSC